MGNGMEKIIGTIIGAVVILLVAGYLFINMWPTITVVSDNVSTMAGTDAGTTIFQSLWPVVIIIVAIVIIVSLIFWAIKQLQN